MPPIKLLWCAALLSTLAGCLDATPTRHARLPAPPAILADERTVSVGGVRLRLPVVLLLSSTRHTAIVMRPRGAHDRGAGQLPIDALLSAPDPQRDTLRAASVEVDLDALQMLQDYDRDESVATVPVCPWLRRTWMRDVCRSGLIDGRHVFYPDRFTLIDETYLRTQRPTLAVYAGPSLSVGEAARASIPAAHSDIPIAHCQSLTTGEKNSLCTIVVRVDRNLLAVWSTNRSHVEQTNEISIQASRLKCLVRRGMARLDEDVSACSRGWANDDRSAPVAYGDRS
jgi:hypothetical protein